MEKIKKEKEAEDAAKLTGKPDMYVLAPVRACVEQHTDARMYNHLTLHCCSCSVASSRSTTQKSHKADKKNVDQMYAEAEKQKKMYLVVCVCAFARAFVQFTTNAMSRDRTRSLDSYLQRRHQGAWRGHRGAV